MSFLPDDEIIAELLENSDIEDNGEVSWDPDLFDLPEMTFTSGPLTEPTKIWDNKDFVTKNLTEKLPSIVETKTPVEIFSHYFPELLFEEIADNTKKSLLSRKKHANYCDTNCIKKFFGVHALMSIFKCPQKQLYFDPKFQYHPISNTLTYEKFRQIRLSLCVVDTEHPDEIEMITNRLWKVQPVIQAVRTRCQQLKRDSNHYSIGTQIINFVGPTSIKRGLKNFIVTNPQGLVVDFEIYQGTYTDLPDFIMGTTAAVVLRLAKTLPGACLYFSQYFTTVALMNELANKGINGTGVLSRWDKSLFDFNNDNGSVEIVSRDDKVCAVKCNDFKRTVLMSTVFGIDPYKRVEEYDAKSRQTRVHVFPYILAQYKKYIVGVDIANQMMDLYATSFKSSKWPVNLILYLFDFSLTNSYFEYKDIMKKLGKKSNEILDVTSFRLNVAEHLLSDSLKQVKLRHTVEDIAQISPDLTDEKIPLYRPPSLATIKERFDGKDHWLVCDKSIKSQRFCRREKCKSRTNIMCSKCKIYLCFNNNKNCFYTFHNRLDKKPD